MNNDQISHVYFDDLQSLLKRNVVRPPAIDRSLARPKLREGLKTLVCHDMKGGYLDEDLLNPLKIGDDCQKPFLYVFWWYTDIFIYFSHHFITVPTVRWINECHIHDVLCLGTFITEGAKGRELCTEIFANEEHTDKLIERMVNLCDEWLFDGWLINIENEFDAALIGNLVSFLYRLRRELKKRIGSHAQLVWYDSIRADGHLEWQNCLNETNVLFADVVDAFYTNYAWKKDHLKHTSRYLECERRSVRPADVYFGVDIFGRGSFAGGQFNTHQAVQTARNYGFSVALFAPGWTSECFGREVDGLLNHDKLFRSMTDIIYPHRINRSFETHFNLGISGDEFDPSRRTILPFMLESDMFSLAKDGLVVGGAKDSKHVLFLTDFRCVQRYELEYNCPDKLVINATAKESGERFAQECPFLKLYDIWEIYCVKLTDEPVLLNHLSFRVNS